MDFVALWDLCDGYRFALKVSIILGIVFLLILIWIILYSKNKLNWIRSLREYWCIDFKNRKLELNSGLYIDPKTKQIYDVIQNSNEKHLLN